jgi:hypothetical protein
MRIRSVIFLAILLVGSASAGAKSMPPRMIFLDRDIVLNGAAVPHGVYTLSLESDGSSVRATLYSNGQFVATAHGTWVKYGIKPKEDEVLLRVNEDGTRSLIEIRLAGLAKTIVLDNANPVLRVSPAGGGKGNLSLTEPDN